MVNTKRILVAESGRHSDRSCIRADLCIRAEAAAAETRGCTLRSYCRKTPSVSASRFAAARYGKVNLVGRSSPRQKRVRARRSNLIVARVPPENGYPLSGITVQGGTFITSHRALARPDDRPAFPAARSARSGEISQPVGFIFYDGGSPPLPVHNTFLLKQSAVCRGSINHVGSESV